METKGELLFNILDKPVFCKIVPEKIKFHEIKVFICQDKIGNVWYKAEISDIDSYKNIQSYGETIFEAIERLKRHFN